MTCPLSNLSFIPTLAMEQTCEEYAKTCVTDNNFVIYATAGDKCVLFGSEYEKVDGYLDKLKQDLPEGAEVYKCTSDIEGTVCSKYNFSITPPTPAAPAIPVVSTVPAVSVASTVPAVPAVPAASVASDTPAMEQSKPVSAGCGVYVYMLGGDSTVIPVEENEDL